MWQRICVISVRTAVGTVQRSVPYAYYTTTPAAVKRILPSQNAFSCDYCRPTASRHRFPQSSGCLWAGCFSRLARRTAAGNGIPPGSATPAHASSASARAKKKRVHRTRRQTYPVNPFVRNKSIPQLVSSVKMQAAVFTGNIAASPWQAAASMPLCSGSMKAVCQGSTYRFYPGSAPTILVSRECLWKEKSYTQKNIAC